MSDLVPDGWGKATINDNIDLMTDYVANGSFESLRNNVQVFDDENYAMYVRLYDIRRGVGHEKQKYVDKNTFDFLKKSQLIEGDILIANIGANVGEVFLMPRTSIPATLAPNMVMIRCNGTTISAFLYHYMSSGIGQQFIALAISGSGQPKLNKTDLKKVTSILPPLPEQQKIAAILSSVDEVIEKTQAQINKLKDLKTGMMQELLSPRECQAANINITQGESKNGLHHTEFKDSPLGRIPVGWEVVTSGSVCTLITKGTTPTSLGFLFQNSGINFIKVESITPSGVINKHKFSYIDDTTHNALARSKIHNGDILITIAGATVGKLAIVNESHLPANTNQALAIVRVDENEIRRKYLYYWLQSNYISQEIECIQTVGAQPNLSLAQIGGFNVALPSLNEQDAITDVLNAIDIKINLYSKKLDSKVLIKKALMQDLLTGKVRVQVDAA
jgi:type I restriction enzyme S subunit